MSTAMTQQGKTAYMTVSEMLDKNKDSIAQSLPKHINPDRLARIALSELRTTPALLNCQPQSLMNAIVKAGQLGLEPGGALGHAYLVPYKTEATLIIGYRGLIALARRSGEIQSLTARVVYENDTFELEYGIDEKLRHIPAVDNPGQMTHAYAVAKLSGGGVQWEVMTRGEIEAIRKRSKAGNSGPWQSDYAEMARKTVVRRLCKYLPISIEMADALSADADGVADVSHPSAKVIDLNAQIERKTIEAAPEQPPATEPTGELTAAAVLAGIAEAKTENDISEWQDAARDADLSDAERKQVQAAADKRRGAVSG